MSDVKEKETVDFGIQEMEDYIAERVEKKAIVSLILLEFHKN